MNCASTKKTHRLPKYKGYMAESASKLVLDIVQADCTAPCPYRHGDGVGSRRLAKKIDAKLKHRVSDGNEVRALERRVKELETAIKRALEVAEKGRRLNTQEVTYLQNTLQKRG